jgi:hypothetical protein
MKYQSDKAIEKLPTKVTQKPVTKVPAKVAQEPGSEKVIHKTAMNKVKEQEFAIMQSTATSDSKKKACGVYKRTIVTKIYLK